MTGAADGGRPFRTQEAATRGHKARVARQDSSDDVASLMEEIADRLAKSRTAQSELRDRIADAQAAAEKERRQNAIRWLKARAVLLNAVCALDALLSPHGFVLSMADDVAPPDLIGAVEIRLQQLAGRAGTHLLDIQVLADGRQRTRTFGLRAEVKPRLPSIDRVTVNEYRRVILAFVECALLEVGEGPVCRCSRCGEPVTA